MAKKKNTAAKQQTPSTASTVSEQNLNSAPFYLNRYFLYAILALLSFAFYWNTIQNDYCLDDLMVITGNKATLKGYDGINELLTKDFLYGFRGGVSHDLASNRWRPLSMISFAIEQEWFKGNPHISHFINILTFVLTVLLLFHFIVRYLKVNEIMGFFISLVFAIHPIHTEVVANIKSRDELFCLLFTLLTLIPLFRGFEKKQYLWLIPAAFSFFLSLLSKENSITFIAAVPLLLYFFSKEKAPVLIGSTLLLIGVTALYAAMRFSILPYEKAEASKELMNNPFLLAVGFQALATKIYLLLVYIKLLILPYPLSFDYSYNHFPYRELTDLMVLLSIVVHIALLLLALVGLKRKSIYSFSILFYFITLSISTNLVVEIGTPLGERLLYMPSLALGFALVYFIAAVLKKANALKPAVILIIAIPIVSLAAYATVQRNSEWKNDNTLNIADIQKCPNSARLCNGAGGADIRISMDTTLSKKTQDSLEYIGIKWLKHGLEIHPTFADCELNLGVAYSRLDSLELCEKLWNDVRRVAPGHPKFLEYDPFLGVAYLNKGLKAGEKDPRRAIYYFEKAIRYIPNNPDLLYNLGGAYYTIGAYAQAETTLTKCLQVKPGYKNAEMGLRASKFKLYGK